MTRLAADYMRLMEVIEAGHSRPCEMAREMSSSEPCIHNMLKPLLDAGVVEKEKKRYRVAYKPSARLLERIIT